ncbi:MAG: alpha/beta hydrolase [Leptolyngbyaceae bacterium]|nr:alpha/beta hydrolase [Leptolyngbyaceae bacterium]
MAPATRQTAHLNSITLSYLEWSHQPSGANHPTATDAADNAPDPTPVLLLHGLADHAGVWQKLGDRLSTTRPVVAPDLRGHGDSSKPDHGYAWTDLMADLNALMDHLGWPTAHVVGHSWSGKLACIWASRQPQRMQRLVLMDPAFTGKFPQWTRPTFPFFYRVLPFLKLMGPFDTYATAEQQAKTLKQYRDWTPFQQDVFRHSMQQNPDGTWSSKFCLAARNGVFEDFTQVAGLTAPISVPTLFIRPQQGLNRSGLQIRPYQQLIQQLEIKVVPGNHWAFLVTPDLINPMVLEFLEAHDSLAEA